MKHIFLAALVLLTGIASAQSINGNTYTTSWDKVYNLSNVTVLVLRENKEIAKTKTDSLGNFKLDLPAEGNYQVKFLDKDNNVIKMIDEVAVTKKAGVSIDLSLSDVAKPAADDRGKFKGTSESYWGGSSSSMGYGTNAGMNTSTVTIKSGGRDAAAPKKGDLDKEVKAPATDPSHSSGKLSAGEWNDNNDWKFYAGLKENTDNIKVKAVWKMNLTERYYISVQNNKLPIPNTRVVLKDTKGEVLASAITNNKGECYLFNNLFESETIKRGDTYIEVVCNGEVRKTYDVKPNDDKPVAVNFSTTLREPDPELNVMFVVDATGSMDDEMSYIKTELNDVVRRIKSTNEQTMKIKMNASYYRDNGDDYTVKEHGFTTDISKLLGFMDSQNAGGGGDYEELADEALLKAVENAEWSSTATAKVLFLVLDAPPHSAPANLATFQKATKLAIEKGIRVIPVMCSGSDKATEFLMRSVAIATGGTYVFLSDTAPGGSGATEATVGKHYVESFNSLLVRLVDGYLSKASLHASTE